MNEDIFSNFLFQEFNQLDWVRLFQTQLYWVGHKTGRKHPTGILLSVSHIFHDFFTVYEQKFQGLQRDKTCEGAIQNFMKILNPKRSYHGWFWDFEGYRLPKTPLPLASATLLIKHRYSFRMRSVLISVFLDEKCSHTSSSYLHQGGSVLDAIRKEAESCGCLQGFQLKHSLGSWSLAFTEIISTIP